MILQDKVVGNVFHFFKLIQVLLHFVSFLIWIHFTVFNFYIHLYTKSTIFNFYFPSYPYCIRPVVRVLSKIFNELWPILWNFYSWLWTKRTNHIYLYLGAWPLQNLSLSFVLFKYRLGNLALHVFLICISRVTFEYLTWPWPWLDSHPKPAEFAL